MICGSSLVGVLGGRLCRDKLFYFYTLDLLRRDYPAVSTPGYAGFYALTSTQTALLANRGVTPAQINAALNYLNSLTGTVARQAGSGHQLHQDGLAGCGAASAERGV